METPTPPDKHISATDTHEVRRGGRCHPEPGSGPGSDGIPGKHRIGMDVTITTEANTPNTDEPPHPRRICLRYSPFYNMHLFIAGQITCTETDRAINTLNIRKSSGPDKRTTESSKLLKDGTYPHLQQCYQAWLSNCEVPLDLTHTRVISFYENCNPAGPANYRPIPLLNTSFKVFADILRERLTYGLDLRLGPCNSDSGKSTARPNHFSA